MSRIYIYSGPIHSGKTTRLEKWAERTQAVDGILAPLIDGKRHLKFLSEGKVYLLEADSSKTGSTIRIGDYIFLNSVFKKAREYVSNLVKNEPDWIVIDEIGFLELEGLGLEPAASNLIEKLKNKPDINILLVVRDYLKSDVIDYYKLDSDKVKDFILDEYY